MADQATKIIITADDYGASPAVNRGVMKALDQGVINTVSAMMNMPNAQEDVRILLEKHAQAHVGLHLSVTAGEPINNGTPSLFAPETHQFMDISNFVFSQVVLDELEEELVAQAKKLLEVVDTIDHVSCHHGVLTLYPQFFEVYQKVAREVAKAPIRNPILISKLGRKGFRISGMKRTGLFTGLQLAKNNLEEVPTLLQQTKPEVIKEQLHTNVVKPDFFVDTFYKQANSRRLRTIMEYLPKGAVSEMVVHLSDQPVADLTPNGVDDGYFRGRYKEFKTLTEKRFLEKLMKENEVTWGSFQDLKQPVSVS